MKRPAKKRHRRLLYETLEPREVLAASITAALSSSGVLNVTGTDGDDQIRFLQTKKVISIQSIDGSWTAKDVKSIVVHVKGGNDFVSLASTANGGNKPLKELVTIKSGGGNETVRLPNSQNVTFNGSGSTLQVTAKSVATLNGATLNLTNKVVTNLKSGVLTVTGTNAGDDLKFRQIKDKISIVGVSGSWKVKKVNTIVVHLQDGNDTVSLNSQTNGGNQALNKAFTINSGKGNHTVKLANGHDVQFNGSGNKLTVSTNGSVVKLNGQTLNFNSPEPDPEPDPSPPPEPPAGNWFTNNIQDAALRALGSSLYVDSVIDRSDMLAIFNQAKTGGVTTTEYNDLKAIVSNSSLFGMFDHVWQLASYVVNAHQANNNYQGQSLGNLAAGSSGAHLEKLVNKWFFGLDRPAASGTYRAIAGTLFVNGASYTDVKQGNVGDCYLLAALAEVAYRTPAGITNMFIVNGDGTYTLRFFNSSTQHFVTVDSYLPTNSSGKLIYASMGAAYNNAGNELWVALAEKAYVQLNEFGWVRPGLSGNWQNSYSAIAGGYISSALTHITGQGTTWNMTSSSTAFNTFVNSWNAGKLIGFASYTTPASNNVVGSHAYTVIGYNSSNQTITLYNPWGAQYGQYDVVVTLNWAQVQANFQYFDRTV